MSKIAGIDFQRVVSYEKLSKNTKERLNSVNNIFTGIQWECVEFVRRWYILNFGVSFQEIPTAIDIIGIRFVYPLKPLRKSKNISFHFRRDWTNLRIGDIIVFGRSNKFPDGHVAIVSFRDKDNIYLSEQNFSNKWESPQYSRKIIIHDILKKGVLGYKSITH